MPCFRRKPTEHELKRVVLYAATLARTKEHEISQLATKEDITEYLQLGFDELKVRPNKKQRELAQTSVNALLTESEFVEEVLRFQTLNPDSELPTDTEEKMVAAIEKTVSDLLKWQKR